MLAIGKALENAISEASKLLEKEQEAIGAWLLAEIDSYRRWDELFAESGTGAPTLLPQRPDSDDGLLRGEIKTELFHEAV